MTQNASQPGTGTTILIFGEPLAKLCEKFYALWNELPHNEITLKVNALCSK
mgnify:CR=1 FL=1